MTDAQLSTPAGAAGVASIQTAQRPHRKRSGGIASPRAQRTVLEACGIEKSYFKSRIEIPVLRGVDLSIREGELLAIVGQSGSGKSTLLHLLGLLDRVGKGTIHFRGERVDDAPTKRLDQLRNRQIGMIFQSYHLLPELTTFENVLTPMMIGTSAWKYFRQRRQHRDAAKRYLEMVGLGHRLNHRPRELSGGEMQRAAIARALVGGPNLLLADEPTGNLDRENGTEIIELLRTLNARHHLTIVMVTHDEAIAAGADRVVRLADGRVIAG